MPLISVRLMKWLTSTLWIARDFISSELNRAMSPLSFRSRLPESPHGEMAPPEGPAAAMLEARSRSPNI